MMLIVVSKRDAKTKVIQAKEIDQLITLSCGQRAQTRHLFHHLF